MEDLGKDCLHFGLQASPQTALGLTEYQSNISGY